MKFAAILGVALLATSVTAIAAKASPESVAEDLTHEMESFYGKPIDTVNSFLSKEYGVTGPIKQDGDRYIYMVPASNPLCGELAVETKNNSISGWQAITWERSDEHQRGRACDQAFKQKLGQL